MLTGGRRKLLEGELKDGYYLEPTILFWSEQYARVPGGDFWPGAGGNHLQKRWKKRWSRRTIRNMAWAQASEPQR